MGLIGLYVALAAAGAQVSPDAPKAIAGVEPSTALQLPAVPVSYRLPAAPAIQIDARRAALGRNPSLPQITPPAMPRDPFDLPTAEVWRDGYAVKTSPVGVKLAWNL